MDEALRSSLATLPALSVRNASASAGICKICGGLSYNFDVVDFNKFCDITNYYAFGLSGISVVYNRCSDCDFIFTTFFDSWNSQDFANFVYNSDYIKVDGEYVSARPLRQVTAYSEDFKDLKDLRFLDYGGGSGIYAAEMQKRGFDQFYNYDPFSQPVKPDGKFDIVSAFEVIEHSPDPMTTFSEMTEFLAPGGLIMFSQTTQPHDIRVVRGSWWYIAPRNGHVSTYTTKTLLTIGKKFGFDLYICRHNFVFAPKNIEGRTLQVLKVLGGAAAHYAIQLYPQPAERLQWHVRELAGDRSCHWTSTASTLWAECFLERGEVEIRVEVLLPIAENFLSEAKIFIDDEAASTTFDGRFIIGRHSCPAPRLHDIRLVTPEPLVPRQLNATPDDRPLGLAILNPAE